MEARKRVQKLFEKYDTSGDGVLTQEEIIPLFETFGMTRGQLNALIKDSDTNQDWPSSKQGEAGALLYVLTILESCSDFQSCRPSHVHPLVHSS